MGFLLSAVKICQGINSSELGIDSQGGTVW